MKKLTSLTLATLAVATASSSAATTVFSFGSGDPANTNTINRVATTGASGNSSSVTVADVRDINNASTGISTIATGTQWFSAGGPGSFAPVGTANYDDTNAVVNNWKASYTPSNFGNIWQQGANGNDDAGSTLTFSGLAANTSYTFTLLSVRANGFLADSGTYSLNYGGAAAGVATTLNGAGTLTGNSVAGSGTGNASGLNAREITWSFNTDATPQDAVLNLSGDWNVNAIIVDSIPEPSSTALLGLGGLALILRRRK